MPYSSVSQLEATRVGLERANVECCFCQSPCPVGGWGGRSRCHPPRPRLVSASPHPRRARLEQPFHPPTRGGPPTPVHQIWMEIPRGSPLCSSSNKTAGSSAHLARSVSFMFFLRCETRKGPGGSVFLWVILHLPLPSYYDSLYLCRQVLVLIDCL